MKKGTRSRSVLLLILLCAAMLMSCGTKRDADAPYGGGFDNATLVSITQSEGYPELRFPVNQLVAITADNMTRQEFLALITSHGDVKVIGQVPSAGLYQLEVGATSVEELSAVKASLESIPGIERAAFNVLMTEFADVGSCPVQPDVGLDDFPEYDKLPYYQTDYYAALEIMQGLRDKLELSQVTIGILEHGYEKNSEFNDIEITNVSQMLDNGSRLAFDTEYISHGIAVSGIICADNDGAGINGLASTLLAGKLRVVMANNRSGDWMDYAVAMEQTVTEGGADIVNSSFGLGPFDNATTAIARDTVAGFTRLMSRYPDVLFVNAAHNFHIPMTGSNQAPGGINLSNTLTVSRWTHDHPETIMYKAGFGSVVDISAPGDDLKVVVAGGELFRGGGTSFATPIVTSAAALLKAVGGDSLSPAEIKTLLLDPAFHGERCEPGGGIQLSFAFPLVDLLWQQYQNEGWAQQYLADAAGDQHTIPEIVSSRLCEDTFVSIDGFGSYELDANSACPSGTAMFLAPDGTSWSVAASHLINDGGDYIGVSMSATAGQFQLNASYPFPDHSLVVSGVDRDMIDADCKSLDAGDGDVSFRFSATSGTYSFTRCSISERTGDGKPKYLRVDVALQGGLHGYVTTYYPSDPVLPIQIYETDSAFSGLIKDVRVLTVDPMGTFSQAVEEACIGEAEDRR